MQGPSRHSSRPTAGPEGSSSLGPQGQPPSSQSPAGVETELQPKGKEQGRSGAGRRATAFVPGRPEPRRPQAAPSLQASARPEAGKQAPPPAARPQAPSPLQEEASLLPIGFAALHVISQTAAQWLRRE